MLVIDWKKQKALQNPHGVDVRLLHEADEVMVSHIVLKPGESLRNHITMVDALFLVLEGTGILHIGDETQKVSKGLLVVSPKKIPHFWENTSNAALRVLVIKTPKPTVKGKVL